MFAGFNLTIDSKESYKDYFSTGDVFYSSTKKTVQKALDKYLYQDGSLSGKRIQDDWFPEIEADIFISHSHKDIDLAIGLAGWLYTTFELRCFIDSCVWGYVDDLLKKINDKYSLNDEKNGYDYTKVIYATSHVYMMLFTRLIGMIDKTECVFLLNTPNSITTTNETIINQTKSPWIYAEILSTELVRKKNISEYRKQILIEKAAKFEKLEVRYDVVLEHLYALNNEDLLLWKRSCSYNLKNKHALDILYKNKKLFG